MECHKSSIPQAYKVKKIYGVTLKNSNNEKISEYLKLKVTEDIYGE